MLLKPIATLAWATSKAEGLCEQITSAQARSILLAGWDTVALFATKSLLLMLLELWLICWSSLSIWLVWTSCKRLKLKILAGNFRYLQPTTSNIVEHGRPYFVCCAGGNTDFCLGKFVLRLLQDSVAAGWLNVVEPLQRRLHAPCRQEARSQLACKAST